MVGDEKSGKVDNLWLLTSSFSNDIILETDEITNNISNQLI